MLKSALTSFSEVLDGAFKHSPNWSTYMCSPLNQILKTSTSASIVRKYLDNRTCYNKIVCTALFNSRWWVCLYELFSIWALCKNGNEALSLFKVYAWATSKAPPWRTNLDFSGCQKNTGTLLDGCEWWPVVTEAEWRGNHMGFESLVNLGPAPNTLNHLMLSCRALRAINHIKHSKPTLHVCK